MVPCTEKDAFACCILRSLEIAIVSIGMLPLPSWANIAPVSLSLFLLAVPPILKVLDVIAKVAADYAGKLLTCCTFNAPSLRLPLLRLVRGTDAKFAEVIAAASAGDSLPFWLSKGLPACAAAADAAVFVKS